VRKKSEEEEEEERRESSKRLAREGKKRDRERETRKSALAEESRPILVYIHAQFARESTTGSRPPSLFVSFALFSLSRVLTKYLCPSCADEKPR
jgi:hypothetical protein